MTTSAEYAWRTEFNQLKQAAQTLGFQLIEAGEEKFQVKRLEHVKFQVKRLEHVWYFVDIGKAATAITKMAQILHPYLFARDFDRHLKKEKKIVKAFKRLEVAAKPFPGRYSACYDYLFTLTPEHLFPLPAGKDGQVPINIFKED